MIGKRPPTEEEQQCCEIGQARICIQCKAITGTLICPRCDTATTKPHREASIKNRQHYCQECADPFPNDQLRVITYGFNPYLQDNEGGMYCICLTCLARDEADRKGGGGKPMSPVRVQLSRGKGWRKPDNTVVVSRPSVFGSPFKLLKLGKDHWTVQTLVGFGGRGWWGWMGPGKPSNMDARAARQYSVECFERWLNGDMSNTDFILPAGLRERIRTELRGRKLACWCPLDQPCHADVLLRLANEQQS